VREATVHVVSLRRTAILRTALFDLAERVHIRYWGTVPGRADVHPTDVLVVDLLDATSAIRPAAVVALADRATLWLATGEAQIDPAWLDIATRSDVAIVHCDPKRPGNVFEPVAAALRAYLVGPSTDRLATLTLGREPFLAPAAHLVRAVCSAPWSVRRPSDLARMVGTSLEHVRRTCFLLGFSRVEHFITCVRMIALEELVAGQRLPHHLARRQVGLGDPSNMRRQLQRAKLGSQEAWRQLQSLR
jgi:hypothetical protein